MLKYPNFSPDIFSVGPLTVRWYGVMYVLGYFVGYLLIKQRVRQGLLKVSEIVAESLITYFIFGMLIGARLVFVFVYDFERYSDNLWEIFAIWHGGLSFHGAVIGMVAACAVYAKNHKISFYSVTDTLAFAAGPGLFFGRMGNFINGELYGRATDVPWAMVFPSDRLQVPRHPSQLYQGLTEGILLWVFLWAFQRYLISKDRYRDGIIGASFLVGYGIIRFLIEFTREPDAQLGLVLGPFSMGQVLCLLMILSGIGVFLHVYKTQAIFKPKALPQT